VDEIGKSLPERHIAKEHEPWILVAVGAVSVLRNSHAGINAVVDDAQLAGRKPGTHELARDDRTKHQDEPDLRENRSRPPPKPWPPAAGQNLWQQLALMVVHDNAAAPGSREQNRHAFLQDTG